MADKSSKNFFLRIKTINLSYSLRSEQIYRAFNRARLLLHGHITWKDLFYLKLFEIRHTSISQVARL